MTGLDPCITNKLRREVFSESSLVPGGCFYSDADLQKMGAHTGVAYLEDRPSASKWLIVMVILSPLRIGLWDPKPKWPT